MSALRLINETTVSSTVSSVDITDVFSEDFDIYKITIANLTMTSAETGNFSIRYINASGSVITSSNYDYASLQLRANTNFEEKKETNITKVRFLTRTYNSPKIASITGYVFNPNNSSSYTFSLWQSAGMVNTNLAGNQKGIGVLKLTNTITGYQLVDNNSKNFDEAVIRTYGLRVDS